MFSTFFLKTFTSKTEVINYYVLTEHTSITKENSEKDLLIKLSNYRTFVLQTNEKYKKKSTEIEMIKFEIMALRRNKNDILDLPAAILD